MSKKDVANVLAILDAIDQIQKYTENIDDAEEVWQIITDDLYPFRTAIRKILATLPKDR